MTWDTDHWEEPIEGAEWITKTPPKLEQGDYIRRRDERLKVLTSYPVGATVPVWYICAYRPGDPTWTSSVGASEAIPVEVREGG